MLYEVITDSVTDFRKDGDQSLGERLFNIAFNSSAAGVGDVAFTYAFKTISNMLKSTGAQKILEYVRPKKIAEGTGEVTSGLGTVQSRINIANGRTRFT